MPAEEASALLRTSCAVLDSWQSTYLAVRERIEASGRDARWEFSKTMLFARSSYMASVCADLAGRTPGASQLPPHALLRPPMPPGAALILYPCKHER